MTGERAWSDAWFDHRLVADATGMTLRSRVRAPIDAALVGRLRAAVARWAEQGAGALATGPLEVVERDGRCEVVSAWPPGARRLTLRAPDDALALADCLASLHRRGLVHGGPLGDALVTSSSGPRLLLAGAWAAVPPVAIDPHRLDDRPPGTQSADVAAAAVATARALAGAVPDALTGRRARALVRAGIERVPSARTWGKALSPGVAATCDRAMEPRGMPRTGVVWRVVLADALEADELARARRPAPVAPPPSVSTPTRRRPRVTLRRPTSAELRRAAAWGVAAGALALFVWGATHAIAWSNRWRPPSCGATADCVAASCVEGVCVPGGFVLVEPGRFERGSPDDEPGRIRRYEPQTSTELTRGYYLKSTEVTQGEWEAIVGNRPAWFQRCGDDCPVDSVNWYEALAYANRVSQAEGLPVCYDLVDCTGVLGGGCEEPDEALDHACNGDFTCELVGFRGFDCAGYRLPSEAEWEWAARAGTSSATWAGDWVWTGSALDDPDLMEGRERWARHAAVSWPEAWACDVRAGADPSARACGPGPAGALAASPWGLHDMLGNVSEWVYDVAAEYDPADRVDPLVDDDVRRSRIARGGAWAHDWTLVRAAYRQAPSPRERWFDLGFRLARTAVPPPDVR